MQRANLAIAVCALLAALHCANTGSRTNVLIIGVDTLRPDHLGCYGYLRDTTPNIDSLAAEGVLFEKALSQAPWTLPSFATVFTSLYPTQHGAVRLGNGLKTSFPTLAGILKAHGYRTGAIINASTLKTATGVNRGFDHYHVISMDGRLADGATRDALSWIDQAPDQPFLMFAHYFDPHRPYAPPPPYHRMYDGGYQGPIGDSFNLEGFSLIKTEMSEQMKVLTNEDWDHIKALYDGEISFTDREIGALLAGLESRGLRRNTLVVFLSDHGEEFYEHRCYGHGHSLYNELLAVPLVFSLPGVLPENRRVRQQVRLVDVSPSVLDILGIESEAAFEGISLKPLLYGTGDLPASGGQTLPPDLAFAESIAQGPELKCIVRYPWKMIYNTLSGEETVFRLDEDPGEHRDLATAEPGLLNRFERMLFPALFKLSETWYVELAGGVSGHRFDPAIRAERGPGIGRIHPCRLFDDAGRVIDPAGALTRKRSGSIITLSLAEVKDIYTLAFQVNPSEFPLELDVRIDGRAEPERIRLGENLVKSRTTPLSFGRNRRKVISQSRPAGETARPYVLIWLEKNRYGDDVLVDHDEQTEREFRALGYIQ